MKLLRAECECGFRTRKARVGYHFHQWWFPFLHIETGELTDISRELPENDAREIQLGKKSARDVHPSYVESVTRELRQQFTGQAKYAFDPTPESAFLCPSCRQSSLRVQQVAVTAYCTSDCGFKFQWLDSEEHGCPICNHRPHRFRTESESQFAGEARTLSSCDCSSTLDSHSHIDAYCPKCGGLPTSYTVNDRSYCGIHHTDLISYRAPGNILFIEARARWVTHQFPNAKLWGDSDSDDSISASFCPACESDHQCWLATNVDG